MWNEVTNKRPKTGEKKEEDTKLPFGKNKNKVKSTIDSRQAKKNYTMNAERWPFRQGVSNIAAAQKLSARFGEVADD